VAVIAVAVVGAIITIIVVIVEGRAYVEANSRNFESHLAGSGAVAGHERNPTDGGGQQLSTQGAFSFRVSVNHLGRAGVPCAC
jgi:hypothetical protein